MYFAMATVAVNIAASFVLVKLISHSGIALATSIAAWINALALITTSLRRGFYRADARFLSRLPRILLCVAIMSSVMWLMQAYWLAGNYAEGAGFAAALWGLLALLAAGIASYFIAAHVLGAFRIGELRRVLRR